MPSETRHRCWSTSISYVLNVALARRSSIELWFWYVQIYVCYMFISALARRPSIQMRFLYVQMCSRSTSVDPNACLMCSDVFSLDACLSKCVFYMPSHLGTTLLFQTTLPYHHKWTCSRRVHQMDTSASTNSMIREPRFFFQCSCSQNDEFLAFSYRSASGHFHVPFWAGCHKFNRSRWVFGMNTSACTHSMIRGPSFSFNVRVHRMTIS